MFKVAPYIQHYQWGAKNAASSLVAKFGAAGAAGPFAESWFGAHPNGMATVGGKPLSDLLAEKRLQLGFQAKILDVATPLSIQLHPPKRDAERLHEERPETYPDPQPKYEGAVALTETRMLLGWREEVAIKKDIRAIARIFSSEDWGTLFFLSSSDLTGKEFYRNLLEACFEINIESLLEFYQVADKLDNQRKPLIDELIGLYPNGDKGILLSLFLNQLTLKEGDGLFIPVGVPHAYLSGCLAEIMVESDNVIRLGLTPKPVDFTEASRCLSFKYHFVSDFLRAGQSLKSSPVRQFQLGEGLELLVIGAGSRAVDFSAGRTNSEILVSLDDTKADVAQRNTGEIISLSSCEAMILPANNSYRVTISGGTILRYRRV